MQQTLPCALAMATQHACHLKDQILSIMKKLYFQKESCCFSQCLVLSLYLAMVLRLTKHT